MIGKRHTQEMIGEQETRERIAKWMREDLGKDWRVLSIAHYGEGQTASRWIAIALNDATNEVREGLFSYNPYGALCYHQPVYRANCE